jgi:PmbA protein
MANAMTHKDVAIYALDALMKAGAGKAACRVARGRKDEFNVEAGEFSLLRTLFSDELSIKVIRDGRKGVAAINKLDRDSIDKAVRDCIALADSATPDEAEDIAGKSVTKTFDQNVGGADMSSLFAKTRDFVEQVRDEFPKIVLEGLSTDFNSSKTSYVNSNGVDFESEVEYYDISSMFSAKDGEKSSSFNGYGASVASLSVPFMDLEMHRALLDESVRSIDARMFDGKHVGKVIVTPACDDMIWQTLIYYFLGDTSMISGTSRWKDSLGTKVADAKLTMRASPLREGVVAGERFTQDGFESADADFIRDGVLASFALSLYGANKTNKPRSPNTAFGNIEVAPGAMTLDEMIRSVDRGILLNRFSGASPGPSGDISGVAKNSFLIEKGVVTDALKETMISFNLVDALANIAGISVERSSNGATLLPWCCLDGVTISGK